MSTLSILTGLLKQISEEENHKCHIGGGGNDTTEPHSLATKNTFICSISFRFLLFLVKYWMRGGGKVQSVREVTVCRAAGRGQQISEGRGGGGVVVSEEEGSEQ